MTQDKSSGDVEDLVSSLKLDGLHYREFATRRPAALELAGGSQATPVPPIAEAPKPALTVAAAKPVDAPRPVSASVVASVSAPKVLAKPVNFTFERLRRQVIGSRVEATVLSLKLRPRPAVSDDRQALLQQPLAELFAALAQAERPSFSKLLRTLA